jgi:uncharacterized protein YdaU (DUF1376 family)
MEKNVSFAYMPLYTGDYLRDTRHLTPTKHGVYLLLLMHCFDQKGPLPLDEQECAGIANCRSADEVDSLRYILERYFIRMDDGWYNRRMQAVIEKAESISNYRSEAGRKGYQARVKQLPNKSHALASNPNPNPILSPTLNQGSSKEFAPPVRKKPRTIEAVGSGETLISIPAVGNEVAICETAVKEWEQLFPSVDVPQTLREIRAWCLANTEKRKTTGGIHRFVTRWLTKEQNHV